MLGTMCCEPYTPVILESPYAGDSAEDVEENKAYARTCMVDSIRKGEAPFLSHLLYTQVLDDSSEVQRELGMSCARAWYPLAKKIVVYTDHGVSPGMHRGIAYGCRLGMEIEYRTLGG
jgi:hypothetical protein